MGSGSTDNAPMKTPARLQVLIDEGLIDGNRSAFHRMGGVAKVTVLRVIEIEDGEAIAIPDSWQPDDATPPPRLRLRAMRLTVS